MQSANVNVADTAEIQDTDPRPFYARGTIQSLVAPMSEEEFRSRYWERQPLIIHRGNPNYFGDLFTLEDFDASTKGGRGYVKTAEASKKVVAMRKGTGAESAEHVLTDMKGGHTLILDSMQEYNPKLGEFCRKLGQENAERFQTNIYLTPPNGKGFQPHWDNHDVFVLQVMGSKHWKVEKTRRTLPQKDGTIEDEGRELRGEVYEFTLQQGDAVYIPRGFVHAAECGVEASLHVTLGFYYNTWDELLLAAVRAAIMRDDNLRLSLPAGHTKGDGAGVIKRMREVFAAAADPAFLRHVLDQYRDELVRRAPLEISGQILSHFRPKEIALDDRFGVRPGLVYSIRKAGETVTLKVGTRAITFADFFEEPLRHALTKSDYQVRDLPGDLEDELKVVFMERLMQEAVVTRL